MGTFQLEKRCFELNNISREYQAGLFLFICLFFFFWFEIQQIEPSLQHHIPSPATDVQMHLGRKTAEPH